MENEFVLDNGLLDVRVKDNMKKKKILMIGYGNFHQIPNRTLKDALINAGHEVKYIPVEVLLINLRKKGRFDLKWELFNKALEIGVFKDFVEIEGVERYNECFDLVIIGQTHHNFRIINKEFKNRPLVLYYHSEHFWFPSVENADGILFTMPEQLEYFQRRYPQHLEGCIDTYDFNFLFNPEEIPQLVPSIHRKKGIYWMGATSVDCDSTYELRTAYTERAEIVGRLANKGLITQLREQYRKEYFKNICNWEAGLVITSPGAYLSSRPMEYGAMGIIPILWVAGDYRKRLYYEKTGFEDGKNCWFASSDQDLEDFYSIPSSTKKELSENAVKLAYERFSAKVKLRELFQWIEVMEDLR